jgi:thiamine biosynthesis protein ThiS
MSFGFNTNVRVGEIVYHVQTEHRGHDAPVIDTVVYVSGRVIHRIKTPLAAGAEPRDQIERQHHAIVAQLENGALTASSAPAPAAAPDASAPVAPSATIAITLNGEVREIPQGLTVAKLLDHLALRPDRVAIERNAEILPKSQWLSTPVAANDRYEIVQLVGGG